MGAAELIGGAFFAGAVVEAGRAAVETADKFAEAGEKAHNAGLAVGMGIEAMQRWGFAAKQLGVDEDSLPRAFSMMENHVSQALTGTKESIRALRALHIDLKEAKRLSGDPGATVERIMQGFNGITNASTKTRVGRDFFGRGWLEIAPLIMAPKKDIQDFFDQIDRSGALMSEKDAKASEDYLRSKHRMGVAVDGLEKKLSVALMPALTRTFDKITAWIQNLKPQAIEHFTNAIGKLADKLPALLPKIQRLVEGATKLADKLLTLADNAAFVKGVFIALVAFMAAQAAIAFISMAANIGGVASAAIDAGFALLTLGGFAEGLTGFMAALDIVLDANPLGLIVLAVAAVIGVAALLIAKWNDVVSFFKVVGDVIGKIIMTMVTLITAPLQAMWDAIPAGLRKLITGDISASVKWLMRAAV